VFVFLVKNYSQRRARRNSDGRRRRTRPVEGGPFSTRGAGKENFA
jgi:hypothetical protein